MTIRTQRRIATCAALLLGLVAVIGCAPVRGSGTIATEDRSVGDVSRVELSGIGRLQVTEGSPARLTVTADDNLMKYITTETQGDTLVISVAKENRPFVNVMPTKTMVYSLQVPSIERMALSGSGEIAAERLETDSLEVEINGSGKLELPALKATRFTYLLSGSGRATISGEVADQDVTISGSGRLDAGDLRTEKVAIDINGSGRSTVWATDSLDVKISGSGTVEYYGSPKVTQEVSGSGTVRSLGSK